MIRAAANGDAPGLKKLLVSGADVNGTNPGGQTALILAALMGRSDIVRLLLEAGADANVRDNLGLTATDWAQRKGFIDVTQVLKNPTSILRSGSSPAASKDIERTRESDYARGNDSRIESQTAAPRKDQQGFGPAAAAFLKARTTPSPPEATLVQPRSPTEQSVPKPDDPSAWWVGNVASRAADDALPAESETLKTRIETERIFEQARQRVEEEVRRKSEDQARRITNRDPDTSRSTRDTASLKRCPKCNTIYEDDGRTYCAYDAGRLVNLQESFNGSASRSFGRPTLWALVAVTLIGSVAVTYFATSYLNKNEASNPPLTVASETVPKADDNSPVVGGALAGKQENVPKAEYPANFKPTGTPEPVTVVVRVNRNGRVMSARALNGPRQLRVAAEQAAKTATFFKEKLSGEERLVAGTITYTFKP